MTLTRDRFQILLVEDSEEDHDTVLEAIRRSGLPTRLQHVSSGDECLVLLQRAGAGRPDLVLMDLNTSSTDGREALRRIKADPLLKSIPVVVVTTSANPRDMNDCFQSGANAYHVKPFSYPDHLQMLTTLFDYWLVQVSRPATQGLSS